MKTAIKRIDPEHYVLMFYILIMISIWIYHYGN
jgi:hypothetical protein